MPKSKASYSCSFDVRLSVQISRCGSSSAAASAGLHAEIGALLAVWASTAAVFNNFATIALGVSAAAVRDVESWTGVPSACMGRVHEFTAWQ